MPVGLQVFNEQGQVIIDLNWACCGLRQKLPFNQTSANQVRVPLTGQLIDVRQFTVVGVNPFVFHTSSAHLFGTSRSGNTWTFTYSHVASDVTFYIFDAFSGIGPSEHGVGIESYAEDGRLLFSSAYPLLRFAYVSQLPNGGNDNFGESDPYLNGTGGYGGTGTGGAYASEWVYSGLPTNRVYAGMLSTYRYGASSSSTTTDYGDALFETLRVTSNGFIVGGTLQLGGEGYGGFLGRAYDERPGLLMMIDVTNY